MRVAFSVVAIWLVLATNAVMAAEPPGEDYPLPTRVRDRPQASLFIGPTAIGNPLMGGGTAPEFGFAVEVPFSPGRRIRLDASRATWLSKYGGDGLPLITDTITMKTLSASVVRVQPWSDRAAGYAAFGVAWYRYDYRQAPLDYPWRRGIDFLMGLEILNEAHTRAFTVEGRLNAAGGPGQVPYVDYTVFKGALVAGAKMRF